MKKCPKCGYREPETTRDLRRVVTGEWAQLLNQISREMSARRPVTVTIVQVSTSSIGVLWPAEPEQGLRRRVIRMRFRPHLDGVCLVDDGSFYRCLYLCAKDDAYLHRLQDRLYKNRSKNLSAGHRAST
jgi:hypothetical protein